MRTRRPGSCATSAIVASSTSLAGVAPAGCAPASIANHSFFPFVNPTLTLILWRPLVDNAKVDLEKILASGMDEQNISRALIGLGMRGVYGKHERRGFFIKTSISILILNHTAPLLYWHRCHLRLTPSWLLQPLHSEHPVKHSMFFFFFFLFFVFFFTPLLLLFFPQARQ